MIEVHIRNTTKIYCPRITFSFNPQGSSWTVNCRQFPLRAGYATTFNSTPGLTLQPRSNLYTALSRIRNRNDIRVLFALNNKQNMALTNDNSFLSFIARYDASWMSKNSESKHPLYHIINTEMTRLFPFRLTFTLVVLHITRHAK